MVKDCAGVVTISNAYKGDTSTGKVLMKLRNLQRNGCTIRPKGIQRDNHQRPNMALGRISPKTATGYGCLTHVLRRAVVIGGITGG